MTILILGIMLNVQLIGQAQDSSFWQASFITDFNIAIGFPTGDYKQGLERNLGGFGFSALFNLNKKPGIFLGLQLSNFRHSRVEGIYFLTYDEFVGDITVNSFGSLTILQGGFRVVPLWRNRLSPYFEASFGGKRMAVKSEVEDPFGESEDPYDSYKEFSQWGISYGGTAGVYYRLVSNGDNDILLNLSGQFLAGVGIDYYTAESGNVGFSSTPLDNYNPKFSTTDLWQVNIGVTFAFGNTFISQ